ncbi:sensor histidine kinase [Spirochaeta africana]|uniref:histidine kinase n=1 Tax=Spirochaeta africana (strain ATCC 700263 / DSM 8902 / Z-7692) TaxID=889378 RepID=H9UFV5_SPIAZ|nr:sensor histidine kinase [Spirochaeta africana]AFG36398.1 signal transduction histidine kinase [Spirochaeta africana DSM 8902]
MKKSILLVLIILISCTALGLSLFFGLSFSREMDRLVQRDRSEVASQVAHRLALLDDILLVLERDIRHQTEEMLQQAYRRLRQLEPDPAAWDDQLLQRVAGETGEIDLYIIESDLVIRRTTFVPDRGLKLGEVGPLFAQFLQDVIGSGEVFTQRFSISNQTGRLMTYSYYSPPGSNFILQASLEFRQAMLRQGLDFSPQRLFDSLLKEHSFVRGADLITFTGLATWSLVTGELVELPPDVLAELRADREVRYVEDDILVSYQPQAFLSQDNPYGELFVLELRYDLGYYQAVLQRFILRGALITLILTIILSALAGVILERSLIRGVGNFRAALLQASEGRYDVRLPVVHRINEYREISMAFNRLVASAAEREHRLEQQARDLSVALTQRDVLLREIHHRVKNNLQIITSLISIEQGRVDSAAAGVFTQINTRVRAMSAVHEILYEADNLQGAQLEELVDRVFRSVTAVYGLDSRACTFSYNLPEMILPVDIAIPLALIMTEAITNSVKYAGSDDGQEDVALRVAASRLAEGGWQLELRDNGPGFPEEVGFSDGFGFVLMRGLAEQIGGSLQLDSDYGAVVRVILPDPTG